MRCRKARKLLSLRMDDRLAARQAAGLEPHLAGCSACRLVAERLDRAWETLAVLAPPLSAPDDWTAIEAGVLAQRHGPLSAWLDLGLVPTRAAAATLLVGMAVVGGAGGLLLARAFPPSHGEAVESQLIAETLGDLPWNSPASDLEPALYAGRSVGERP